MAENSDAHLLVNFFTEPVEMAARSEQEGRPIFEDREFVRIAIPTDMATQVVRLVEANDKQRFAEQYKAFKDSQKKSTSGTPIEEWPLLSKSRVAELKGVGIQTVEQLANAGNMSREQLGPDAVELSAQARAFLAAAKGTGEVQHIAAENERLKDENANLKADLAAASAEVKRLTDEADKAKKKAA